MSQLRHVVELLARALADEPQHVKTPEVEHRGTTSIELFAAAPDVGKIVGRQGRTIAAIRTLTTVAAEREGKKITLEVRASTLE